MRISNLLFIAVLLGASASGCDDPCADLSDRCDECEGSDKDVCERIVDNYDYDACDEAFDSNLCRLTGEPSGNGAGGDGAAGSDASGGQGGASTGGTGGGGEGGGA